jgi:hypothetical protein
MTTSAALSPRRKTSGSRRWSSTAIRPRMYHRTRLLPTWFSDGLLRASAVLCDGGSVRATRGGRRRLATPVAT